MRQREAIKSAAEFIAAAAYTRSPSSKTPWDYGWPMESYRRSAEASIRSDRGDVVGLSAVGVQSLEQGVKTFLSIQNVQRLYDESDLWVLLTSLTASVPTAPDRENRVRELIAERLSALTEASPSTVVLPVSNTSSSGTPIVVAGLTIAVSTNELFTELRTQINSGVRDHRMRPWWLDTSEGALLLVYSGQEQMGKAVRTAERRFEDVIATSLMFEEDLEGKNLVGLRGDSHRPGIRGLSIDREYLAEQVKKIPQLGRELGAPVVVTSRFGTRLSTRWFAEPPLPLADLLKPTRRISEVETVAKSETDCYRRLATAARWHARAYWSSTVDDAVLALGVAFDAMLSEANPSPGRVLAERFALLGEDPIDKKHRYRTFQSEIYPARSAVAHGARRKSVDAKFVREVARHARNTFKKIFAILRDSNAKSEYDYNEIFEALKWGARNNEPSNSA